LSESNSLSWAGTLQSSFQLMGGVHFHLILDGYPDTGKSNSFLEGLKGKHVRFIVEGI